MDESDIGAQCRPLELEPQSHLNPQAVPFQPITIPEIPRCQNQVSLASDLTRLYTLNRLPLLEHTVFTGDVLKFADLMITFLAIIDQKPIATSEKMFYLKSYLGGEARKAFEGLS